MDVFNLRNRLVKDYAAYTRSFIKISDERINKRVEEELDRGALWPDPLLQLNPTFSPGGTIDNLIDEGLLHPECSKIFRFGKTEEDPTGHQLQLHAHQADAIRKSKEGKSYILTSGTGSGKSLTYIIPIVDHILQQGSGKGIQAIVVYPMNALANSQDEELSKFILRGYPDGTAPVTFARYTGQEKGEIRENIRKNPPDILLTNYMMLELLLTRREDKELVSSAQGLRYLVFDELHTYRGRQGADVALLIRRARMAFHADDLVCIGTSATMASGGSTAEQKNAVANVAETLFGTNFTDQQVIGETLERATPEYDFSDQKIKNTLQERIRSAAPPPAEYNAFQSHPLSSWIESTFGVQTEANTNVLIRQTPRALEGDGSASKELAELTATDEELCANVLMKFLREGSDLRKDESSRYPLFAFRLHQFFTRGDTVWTTIESEANRHIELSKLGSKPGEPNKPMYPLVFCRSCGQAYYRVYDKHEDEIRTLSPREDRHAEGEDGSNDAYLYISSESPWPVANDQNLLERLPQFMKETGPGGVERVRTDKRGDLPESISVQASGKTGTEEDHIPAAIIHKNFLFCLNPSCGIAWEKAQRAERTKLATLGVDNRSTATTILALRSLLELQTDSTLSPDARKLLSFTDNRQDASLQAGHFNDFAQVSLLRSALYKATAAKGTVGLSHADLTTSVFNAMDLDFDDYASDPNIRGPARESTKDALRKVIQYFLYRDLKRGWRVTAPNLEDCGLLKFDYEGLLGTDGLLNENELWESGFERTVPGENQYIETPVPLQNATLEIREEILRTFLDVLRRGLALKVDVLLKREQQHLLDETNPRIAEHTVWYLREVRDLAASEVAFPRSRQKNERTGPLFISSYTAFGRYLRRSLQDFVPANFHFKREAVDEVIRFIFFSLQRYGILEQVRSGDVPGFQINPAALRWIAGDGEIKPVDNTRLIDSGEIAPEVNQYFVDSYKNFIDLNAVLEAREHTAQVAAEDRQSREDRFRTASLPLLFCSPTMELGVDIAQLNMVNLRNVPPTPANYAQRSGRAGRSGQPALVYTYCAGKSPHDQYYYRRPTEMVSGIVAPPRVDLRNRDLLRSHLHAIWLEVANADLGLTLSKIIDIDPENGKLTLPIKSAILTELREPSNKVAAQERAEELILAISNILEGAGWFHDNWIKETLDGLEQSFESACNRWRSLYRAAINQRELHHKIIGDQSRRPDERAHSKRLRAQAESQIKLLTEAAGAYEGDFYSYRYFAAEGFLPGYNFPRLPISAFVPARRGRKGRDEYVSRPRFLAVSEFGPRALIYHEGARYRVYKVNLDFGVDDIESTHDLVTQTMKRCPSCGYAHLSEGNNLSEMCDSCGAGLDGSSLIQELVQMQNVSLKLAQRITCDEEERQRFGYKIRLAYRFPEISGREDRRDADVYLDGQRVMSLRYADATTLFRINLGWSNQRDDQAQGFLLNLERGYWETNPIDNQDAADTTSGQQKRVVPFVTDTKNALIMRFHPVMPREMMAGIQAAFKEAIQKVFQLESRELRAESLPTITDRKEILFYEAAEGGAGILRQMVDDPTIIQKLARRALIICHYNPDTLEDLAADRCGKACYECLLDYTNQPDHQILDRSEIRDYLASLLSAEVKPAGGAGSREERLIALRKECDSNLEEKWLDMVDSLGLKLPSDAQYLIKSCSTKPDFYYKDNAVTIYVDGPPHDDQSQQKADAKITQHLMQEGYVPIRFHHKDDWEQIFHKHPDIFGKIQ